jgi:hypothetical protein
VKLSVVKFFGFKKHFSPGKFVILPVKFRAAVKHIEIRTLWENLLLAEIFFDLTYRNIE